VLALPPAALEASLRLLRRPRRNRKPSRAEEKLAFRRLHAMLHNLATAAALLGRRPLIPTVPCDFVRAVQPKRPVPTDRSRLGLILPSVVATGPAHAPTCHLGPAEYSGAHQCTHAHAMSAFDLGALLRAQPSPPPRNGSLRLRAADFAAARRTSADTVDRRVDRLVDGLAPWRRLCREGARLDHLPLVTLHGVADADADADATAADADADADAGGPGGGMAGAKGAGSGRRLRRFDALLDSAITPREFRKVLGGTSHWPSLLQPAQLQQLLPDCPAAANLSALRHACAGYFLTA